MVQEKPSEAKWHMWRAREKHGEQKWGAVGKTSIWGYWMAVLASEWMHPGEGALGTVEPFCRASSRRMTGGCCLTWLAMHPGSKWIKKDARQ